MENDEMLLVIKGMFEKSIEKMEKKIDEKIEEVKNHMGVIAESLESDIKVIAAEHDFLNKKIDEKADELKKEIKIAQEYIVGVDAKLNEHEVILKRVK